MKQSTFPPWSLAVLVTSWKVFSQKTEEPKWGNSINDMQGQPLSYQITFSNIRFPPEFSSKCRFPCEDWTRVKWNFKVDSLAEIRAYLLREYIFIFAYDQTWYYSHQYPTPIIPNQGITWGYRIAILLHTTILSPKVVPRDEHVEWSYEDGDWIPDPLIPACHIFRQSITPSTPNFPSSLSLPDPHPTPTSFPSYNSIKQLEFKTLFCPSMWNPAGAPLHWTKWKITQRSISGFY